MSNREKLQELNNEVDRLNGEMKQLRANIQLDPQYEEYDSIENADERKEKYPELFAKYEKLVELDAKMDSLLEECSNKAKDVCKEIDEKMAEHKEAMVKDSEELKGIMQRIDAIDLEIEQLKGTDKYKNGDEATIAKVGELEAELQLIVYNKEKIEKRIEKSQQEINRLQGEKDELVEEYGEEILTPIEELAAEEVLDNSEPEQELQSESEKDEELITKAKQRYNEIEQKLVQLERQTQANTEEWRETVKEIDAKRKEIKEFKETEAYKNGDEATLAKVKELDAKLKAKFERKLAIAEIMRKNNGEIKRLQQEKEKLVEEYGKEILPVVEKTENEGPVTGEQEAEEAPAAAEPEQKEDPKPKQRQKAANNSAVYNTNPVVNPVVTDSPNVAEERKETPKQQFNKLYVKAKNGDLTQEEFTKLAEIMQDPSKYDELGITTGIVFNKSKAILKSMARMAARTGKTVKLSKEKLGIEIEKATEENGYLSTPSIKDWKGLKTLMNNPEQKIASEELFKKIVETDRETLNDEQKEVYDRASEHLNRFEALRGALQTYGSVSKHRMQEKWSWLFEFNEEAPKPLASAEEGTKPRSSSLSDTLGSQVDHDSSYEPNSPKPVSRDEQQI